MKSCDVCHELAPSSDHVCQPRYTIWAPGVIEREDAEVVRSADIWRYLETLATRLDQTEPFDPFDEDSKLLFIVEQAGSVESYVVSRRVTNYYDVSFHSQADLQQADRSSTC